MARFATILLLLNLAAAGIASPLITEEQYAIGTIGDNTERISSRALVNPLASVESRQIPLGFAESIQLESYQVYQGGLSQLQLSTRGHVWNSSQSSQTFRNASASWPSPAWEAVNGAEWIDEINAEQLQSQMALGDLETPLFIEPSLIEGLGHPNDLLTTPTLDTQQQQELGTNTDMENTRDQRPRSPTLLSIMGMGVGAVVVAGLALGLRQPAQQRDEMDSFIEFDSPRDLPSEHATAMDIDSIQPSSQTGQNGSLPGAQVLSQPSTPLPSPTLEGADIRYRSLPGIYDPDDPRYSPPLRPMRINMNPSPITSPFLSAQSLDVIEKKERRNSYGDAFLIVLMGGGFGNPPTRPNTSTSNNKIPIPHLNDIPDLELDETNGGEGSSKQPLNDAPRKRKLPSTFMTDDIITKRSRTSEHFKCRRIDPLSKTVCGMTFARALEKYRHLRTMHPRKGHEEHAESQANVPPTISGQASSTFPKAELTIGPIPMEGIEHITPSTDNGVYCSICNKRFRLQGEFNKHQQTVHEKPFECSEEDCDKRFGTKKDAQRHFDAKHLEIEDENRRRFACEHWSCVQTFSRHDNMLKHMKKQHS
ncbi:hypothetical protein DL98DRAFT_595592 [Cadophora sp. DSE1049]|nr:hypothetical protein DL98DRAFT_595592 [Cadophora sp. DSE1049]